MSAIKHFAFVLIVFCFWKADAQSQTFTPWRAGELDIYQISTGMGNATFCILPDGTTLLIEAGAINEKYPRAVPPIPKPNGERSPGDWISRFIKSVVPAGSTGIDYALLTHFHDDHMGAPNELSKNSAFGNYKLTGITEVGELIPIKKIIDRGWPDYNYPTPLTTLMIENYRGFLDWHVKNKGLVVESFRVGHNDQIVLKHEPKKYRGFEIRNIAGNGNIWTGLGQSSKNLFPDLSGIPEKYYPNENSCSNVLKLNYGKFDYFLGGDIYGILETGKPTWHDMETPVAKVIGEVDVQVVNHHGYRDSQSEEFIKALKPQVYIVPAWASVHPEPDVLKRMLSEEVYPGKREVFLTTLLKESAEVNKELLPQLSSTEGHVLVRVEPGGKKFQVIIIDNNSESMVVKQVFGPYTSR